MTKPLSQRAYARHRGCSPETVRKAIKTGRLKRSLAMVGKSFQIADPELADQEWLENTRPWVRVRVPEGEPDPSASDPTRKEEVEVEGLEGLTYSQLRRLKEMELLLGAKLKREGQEIERARQKGQLVPVEEARTAVLERLLSVRNKLLALPTRIAQRFALSAQQMEAVEDVVREALEEIADAY